MSTPFIIALRAFRIHRDILAAHATVFFVIGSAIVGGLFLSTFEATPFFAVRAFRIHLDILAARATFLLISPFAAVVERVFRGFFRAIEPLIIDA